MNTHHQVLVIGGGTAGITVAAHLKRRKSNLSIAIIEPGDTHYYQPAWTLVGVNAYDYNVAQKPMKEVIPPGVDWIKQYADKFDPKKNQVTTKNGDNFTYDYLVVCPGIKIDTSLVEGLTEAVENGVVCSNYIDPKVTWKQLQAFKGGTAHFAQPTTPIKCAGAPQKIMYLAHEYFAKQGIGSKSNIAFALNTPGIFAVKEIAKTLMEIIDRKKIQINFNYNLVAVDGKEKIAWYETPNESKIHNQNPNIKMIDSGKRKGIKFDFMHLAPPQTAPDFIKQSPFANEGGWMNVDSATLQSPDYRNVFGLGDASSLPTSKTGSAIRKQVPVVVENVLRMIEHDSITDKKYNGYSACPFITGFGKMVLAEFDYDKKFTPDPQLKKMLVFNSDKEHWRLWVLKKYILPYLYWNKMLKGYEI